MVRVGLGLALTLAAGCHSTSSVGIGDAGWESGAGSGQGGIGAAPGSGPAGGGAGAMTAAGGAGAINGAGGGGSTSFGCPINPSACSDGKDNDGDGLFDGADPECSGPCDNDEASFATGIPGDNIDACKQDCFFDGNSGMGDDRCEWNLKCDPKDPGAHAARSCPYDPSYRNCPGQQSAACINNCQRITPNGCDCFGCCAVGVDNQTVTVLLVPTCKASSFGDPNACPRCTQQTSCVNPCDKCEVCVGKPAPDPSCAVPPPGTTVQPPPDAGAGGTPPPAPCPPGAVYCGSNPNACSGGTYCLTGCCLIP
jgi:hypothetical protein